MKTIVQLTALLVLATQVVCSQTPANRSTPANKGLRPVVKHQPVAVVAIQPAAQEKTTTVTTNEQQKVEAFQSRIEDINKQIAELENLKLQVNGEINEFFIQNNASAAPSLSIPPAGADKEQLMKGFQKQADELLKQSSGLKQTAGLQSGTAQQQSLQTALQLEEQAFGKQIQASVLSGKISREKFDDNADRITVILRTYYGNQSRLDKAGDLVFDANRSMRLAAEIREEANTYMNTAAKLGAMQNAEEKEMTALSIQNQVMGMFVSTVCSN